MIEHVNGVVLGPVTITATIHTPDGKPYGNPKTFEITESSEARMWAEGVRANTLRNLGLEAARLGWDRPWEMRTHD
jgi:hypothetical protein